jgi:hypothetical protein
MGLVTALSITASGTSVEFAAGEGGATTLLTPTGMGIGGLIIAIALVFLLGYLNVISARENVDARLRHVVISVAIPLLATFGGIVVYESIQIVTS